MTEQIQTTKSILKPKRPYDPTNNKDRGYAQLWAVYPDYWPEKWGALPCLGHVRADTEYDAVYAAYDKGLSHPNNCSFGLKIVKATPRPYNSEIKRNKQ